MDCAPAEGFVVSLKNGILYPVSCSATQLRPNYNYLKLEVVIIVYM